MRLIAIRLLFILIPYGLFAQNSIQIELDSVSRSLPIMGLNGNTIRGPSWIDTTFNDSVATMCPGLLRYPGGNNSNYWNWETGWFYDQAHLDTVLVDTQYVLSSGLSNLPPIDIRPIRFKEALDQIGSEGIFVMNMMSSSISTQMTALRNASDSGIVIKRLELGCELNRNNVFNEIKFPTAGDYARACNIWIDSISSLMPNVKIGVVGGNRGDDSTRSWRWNDSICSIVNSADALIWHLYIYLKDKDTVFTDKQIVAFPFYRVPLYEKWRSFQDTVAQLQNHNIWMTEYNLFDKTTDKCYSNTWSHVLILAGMNNKLLENDLVSIMLQHNVGGVFPTFDALDTDNGFIKMATGISSMIWNKQMLNMFNATQLKFPLNILDSVEYQNSNLITNKVFYPKLFGWKFENSLKESAVIVNISNDTLIVSVSSVFNNDVSWLKLTSDSLFTKIDSVDHIINEADSGKFNIKLLPYSINVASSNLCADTSVMQYLSICHGDSIAFGGSVFYLSGTYGDTLVSINGCDSVVILNLTVNTVDNDITNTSPILSANASGAIYQWLDCNNNYAPIAGETNQSFTATSNGSYAVEVTQNGCTDTTSCEQVNNVGIIEINSNLTLHPNPTNDIITIQGYNGSINVEVFDLQGKLLQTTNSTTISLKDYAKGIYVFRVAYGDIVEELKVVKD